MQLVEVVEVFERPGRDFPRRRMAVFRRADGYYSFAEQYHYNVTDGDGGPVLSEGWAARDYVGIFETIEIAATEAVARRVKQ